ncbi:MAG: GNAT family N-acetyltransferase [Syntrophobacteraceae bacterium]
MASDKSPYTFEMIESSESLAALRPRWESLLKIADRPGLFFHWDWNYAWWQSFSKNDDRLVVVLAERNGEPFGLAPFFVRRSNYYGVPRRLLRFIGEGHSDRADVLVREHTPIFYRDLFAFLCERVEWDLIYLRELPEGSGLLDWARTSGMLAYVEEDSECPYIPFSADMTPESFRQSLSRKTRAEFRSVARRLKEIGEGSFHHRSITGPEDLVLEQLRDIEINSAKGTRNIHLVFSPEGNFSFQKRLLGQFNGSVQPLLSTLELNGETIAYLYGFVTDRVYHAYNMAFLPEYARVSPGKFLMQEAIEHCIREGLSEFDFLRGGSYIKSKWTDRHRRQEHLTIFRNSLLNRVHGWAIFDLRPKIKPLLSRLRNRSTT